MPFDFINQCLKSDDLTMDFIVDHVFTNLTIFCEDTENEEKNEQVINFFEHDSIVVLNKVEENYWNLFVIFPDLKTIEIIDSRKNSKSMETEIGLIWEFMWYYCAVKEKTLLPRDRKYSVQEIQFQKNNMYAIMVSMLYLTWLLSFIVFF